MDVRREQNFFEGRVTEYQKASPSPSSPTTSCRKGHEMIIDFDEILDDLELKRAAAAAGRELPGVRRRRGGRRAGRRRRCGWSTRWASERPLDAAPSRARWVADALATLAAARGEERADTAPARALVRATALAVLARLRLLGRGARHRRTTCRRSSRRR